MLIALIAFHNGAADGPALQEGQDTIQLPPCTFMDALVIHSAYRYGDHYDTLFVNDVGIALPFYHDGSPQILMPVAASLPQKTM